MKDIKIITEHWGKINPLKIEEYINFGGYGALEKFVLKMNPEKAIEEIQKSGLCGRGGAGFPTGDKLEMVAKNTSETKYFICNLEESEPGTYKDRLIVDNNPHILLEGIIISALSIGAKKAFIYINGNYEKQKEILEKALAQSREKKYWGENILGSAFRLEIEIYSGAGAYICGEETALINSVEGNRGEPKLRPPFPTEVGLFGSPTVVDNAETIANIPWIILNGGKKYSAIGSKNSPGTKIFLLNGAVEKPGTYEAPTGITVKKLIDEYAGGIKKGKEFWFAQIGGACGKLLLEKELKVKMEFGKECECPLGSGSILVVDKSVNIHDLLISWTDFFRRESCGKCVPCREGTFRLWEIAKRFRDGKISDRDKKAIEDILWTLDNTTFCPLGKFAGTAFRDAIAKNILTF
ncbi:MAG: NADH:ubiquinone oxidoreductase, NADH-binding (51 kD) subunit [Candidatus Moranbacteria bacterium GW2011_GWF2_36_839]|nr:MAG: NADH:ubiquinone oxidoreductase, NADH-binding (51 kD) subunit [Candidatus Moranbacteria bacterium GW2011_GWF1_36_78]KKQ16505.1 MAG: NADH:ubiquinone oxidoreductase, NADH-binding (51 kD) subunit [Candidatus Moranbacteria bacterium GW2011_GWF2_36_839]HAT74066.1 NADH-quinone oxidoreductase subunit F [Candidatus Moranbacteria bacterium]HBY10725.1 NADH-quinone oxidoreductase subunit F [Candidatus Moranbacteria bacterium]